MMCGSLQALSITAVRAIAKERAVRENVTGECFGGLKAIAEAPSLCGEVSVEAGVTLMGMAIS
jgi:hypothetical protein